MRVRLEQETPYRPSKKQRSLLERATPVFYLTLLMVALLVCMVGYQLSSWAFRPSYNPLVKTPVAALLPTAVPPVAAARLTPRPVQASDPVLLWTFDMTPLTNGQYMVPDNVKADLQAVWVGALNALDAMSWESVNLDNLFTGQALANARQQLTGSGEGPLTKTVPGGRVFTVVGCNKNGSSCDVTEVFGQIHLDQYDAGTRAKLRAVPLATDLLYLFSGTLVWTGGGWRVAVLQEPVAARQ